MANINDQLLVIGVNYTSWPSGGQPRHQIVEIIEIGLCALDLKKLEVGQRHALLVRPMKSRISSYCTEQTLITQADVDEAEPLVHVCDELRAEFNSKYRPWATWGGYSQLIMSECCQYYNISWPFAQTCLDVRNLFAICTGNKREGSIEAAADELGLNYEGRLQRGCDRAYNVCRIMKSLLWGVRGRGLE